MEVRRLVTGLLPDGTAGFLSDGPPPRTHDFRFTPGQSSALAWTTAADQALPAGAEDPTLALATTVATAGATIFLVIEVPPGSTRAGPASAEQQRAEMDEIWPGLHDTLEPGSGGFHTTPTVDYVVMLSGELWLELDAGRQAPVRAGDVVVQQGTRHRWHNRSDAPARFAVIQVGARLEPGAPAS